MKEKMLWASKENIFFMIISVVSILTMALFFFTIVRYRPWIGDDVLHCFTGGISCYITGKLNLGERFNSFSQVLDHAKEYYMSWGGRLLTGITDPLLVMGGKTFSAIITVLTFIGILLAGLRLVYKSLGEVLLHPLSIICVGAICLFYNTTMGYSIMRVMVDLYGFSFLLYLILINLNNDCLNIKNETSWKMFIFMNVIGFLAGISHELLGAWFIFQLLFKTLIVKKNIKKLFIHCKYFGGLFLGYIICFVAPGNYVRAKHMHEVGLKSPIVDRLVGSINVHCSILFHYEAIGKYIFMAMFLTAIIAVVFLGFKHQYKFISLIVEKAFYVFVSIILWTLVASTPQRGVYGAMLYVLLMLVEVIYEAERQFATRKYIIISVASLILFVTVLCDCCSWIPSMARQAQNRERLIEEAVENHEAEVHVPVFSEECNREIFFKSDVDSQSEYDWIYYTRMYGVHVILEE